MPITGREAGNPMLRKCYWACFSMAMRLVWGVSRKIERATYEAVPFRFIAGNQHPDQDTLSTFRRTFRPVLKHLCGEVGLFARSPGRADVGTGRAGGDTDACRSPFHSMAPDHATPGAAA